MPRRQSFANSWWASRPSFLISLWAKCLLHTLCLKTDVGPRYAVFSFCRCLSCAPQLFISCRSESSNISLVVLDRPVAGQIAADPDPAFHAAADADPDPANHEQMYFFLIETPFSNFEVQ